MGIAQAFCPSYSDHHSDITVFEDAGFAVNIPCGLRMRLKV